MFWPTVALQFISEVSLLLCLCLDVRTQLPAVESRQASGGADIDDGDGDDADAYSDEVSQQDRTFRK